MDLKQLTAFVRVAELGSFSRAATALSQSQPLLSRQVRMLELEHHQSLLRRNGRGVTLTEAGLVLLEHGRGILHQVALAQEALGAVRGSLAGHVAIGLPPSLSKLIAVPLVRAFHQHLPQAQISLTEGFSLSMLEGLRAGRLDLVVMYAPPASPDLEAVLLGDEALMLVSAIPSVKDRQRARLPSSLTLQQLSTLPLLLPSRPNAFRMMVDAEMARIGCKPQIAMEIDGLNTILDLVNDGLGYAVLPRYALKTVAAPHAFALHRITAPRLHIQLHAVRSAKRPTTETHREALQLVQRVFAKLGAQA